MSFDYAEIALTAHELLAEFGTAGKLSYSEQSGDYNPETGDYNTTTVEIDVVGCVFPVDQKMIDGTTVLATDEQALLSAFGLDEVNSSWALTLNGKAHTIIRAQRLAPAGLPVLHTLIVRR